MYFDKRGRLVRGVHVMHGRFYAADRNGQYLKDRTAALRTASAEGLPAIGLLRLLGAPRECVYSASCDFDGDDGLWVYKNFIVSTRRPMGAKPFGPNDLRNADQSTDSVQNGPVETVYAIEAR